MDGKLRKLLGVLLRRSERQKPLVCIGRTHGQHGVPNQCTVCVSPSGQAKLAGTSSASNSSPRVVVGQMTGAVGTQAALGPKAMEVQGAMME